MTEPQRIFITAEQMDAVLDNLLVLRPPIDRVRFGCEFVTADVICVYDRPDANPRMVLTSSGTIDPDNLTAVGWLVVSPVQFQVLSIAKTQRQAGQPVDPALLANLLDDAGRDAPAIVPPTAKQLARPRWRNDGRHHVFIG